MVYKRKDGRKLDEMRPIKAKVGIIDRADGSAMLSMGKTRAIVAVYGPRQLHPTHLRNPEKGILRCHYNMMSFSGSGDRVRPGPSRRSKEISMVTQKALSIVLDLKYCPNAVVDVFIELTQTDAGTRCAGITAASMALADAGLPMKDLVCAISVGKVEGQIVVDLDNEEDCELKGTDIPIAITPRTGEISLLQLDGEITKEELGKAIESGKKACYELYEVQKKALKEKYGGEK